MNAPSDDAESVDAFLERIASLKGKRDREDEERTRKLEEEIIQGRRERQARRAERARSISPLKSSPAAKASSATETPFTKSTSIDPPTNFLPSPQRQPSPENNSMASSKTPDAPPPAQTDPPSRSLPPSPTKNSDTPGHFSNNAAATGLSRSGTLSWQQRPSSKNPSPSLHKPIPTRSADPVNSRYSKASKANGSDEKELSRSEIARSLSTKDPAWFRQTADRGVGSAALRKQPGELTETFSRSASVRLPGLSRDAAPFLRRSPLPSPEPVAENEKSSSPPPGSSSENKNGGGSRFPSTSPPHAGVGIGTAVPTPSSQKLEPHPAETQTLNEHRESDDITTTRPRVRISPERPASPTKGLGGFVQSAMMKRSDSVSKRWSTQAAPGLKRADSIAANRGAMGTARASTPLGKAGSSPMGHTLPRSGPMSSPPADSRPSSSHDAMNPIPKDLIADSPGAEEKSVDTSTPSVKEAPKTTKILTSSASLHSITDDRKARRVPSAEETLPVSPTKTMDPRRWSPTKASWLESALSKPESPKITSPRQDQPPWMADLQKSKQSKADAEAVAEAVKSPSHTTNVISSAPILRSSPPMEEDRNAHASTATAKPQVTGLGIVQKPKVEKPKPSLNQELNPPKSTTIPRNAKTILSNSPPSSTVTQVQDRSETQRAAEDIKPTGALSNPSLDSSFDSIKKKEPPALKPKPSTPPKTDFRSNLKTRQKGLNEAPSKELEFKQMFGKLKSTETKNYVAPNEVKTNLLKGKAGLNLTGAPQNAQRVDEFKDNIVNQNDLMTTVGGSLQKKSSTRGTVPSIPPKPSLAPEALTRTDLLNRTTSSSDKESSTSVPSPAGVARIKPPNREETKKADRVPVSQQLSSTLVAEKPVQSFRVNQKAPAPTPRKTVQETPVPKHQDNLPVDAPSSLPPKVSSTEDITPLPERILTPKNDPVVSSKLANRLNPALAGFLSRGAGSAPGSRNQSVEDLSSSLDAPSRPESIEAKPSEDSQLTHMTKARAKGPKRRLPKGSNMGTHSETTEAQPPISEDPLTSVTKAIAKGPMHLLPSTVNDGPQISENSAQATSKFPNMNEASAQSPPEPRTARALATIINKNEKIGPAKPKQEPAKLPAPKHIERQLVDDKPTSGNAGPVVVEKQKPVVAAKSPELKRVFTPPSKREALESSKLSLDSESTGSQGSPMLISSSSNKIDTQKDRKDTEMSKTVKDTKALWSSPPSAATSADNAKTSPNPKPILQKGPDVTQSSKQEPAKSSNGLGLRFESAQRADTNIAKPELTSPPEEKLSKPVILKGKPVVNTKKPMVGETKAVVDDQKTQRDAVALFERFFDETPRTRDKADFNSLSLVSSSSSFPEKSKFNSMQIWEINADGRKQSLPPQQEHILFEDFMYLCVHSFDKIDGGNATEVYLWCGDGVSDAAMEDVQLFCRKTAREKNAKLEVLRQGKETANFFQALGGIVITRRSKSSAIYMLCGRRHLGHVAFDEVDMDLKSLCSGFPYIVSATFGKLYLWKGKGSGADELGCARLIANDLGLTGEMEEINEGQEPVGFFQSFQSSEKAVVPQSSGHWVLKGGNDRYACRLFRVEIDQPKSLGGFWTRRGSSPSKAAKTASIQEISPFAQKDLDASHIYILDAYFELYIFVGPQATSKSAEFVTAVLLADEYRMLATSVEDRPLIPSCYVLFHGAPQDFQAVFRKWSPAKQTGAQPLSLGLHAAIVALE